MEPSASVEIAMERTIEQSNEEVRAAAGWVEPLQREIAVMYRRNKPQSGPMSAFLDLLGEIYGTQLPR